jgi:hypothetical protein
MVRETVRCNVCRAEYAEPKWHKLVLDRRIEPSEIRLLISEWPEDVRIEVRSCCGCGHAIAAKRPRNPGESHA